MLEKLKNQPTVDPYQNYKNPKIVSKLHYYDEPHKDPIDVTVRDFVINLFSLKIKHIMD